MEDGRNDVELRASRKGVSRTSCGKNWHFAFRVGYTFHAFAVRHCRRWDFTRFLIGVPLPPERLLLPGSGSASRITIDATLEV